MIEIYEPVDYPIFRRMDENVILGMSAKTIVMIAIAFVLGGLLFIGTGFITHDVEVKASSSELSKIRLQYENYYDAICYEDLVQNQNGYEGNDLDIQINSYRNHTFSGMTEDEIHELAQAGREAGVTKDMKRSEASGLAPTYITEKQPVVADFHRALVCFLPGVLVGCLRFEREGVSLLKEIKQYMAFRNSQKIYQFRSQE